MRHKITKICPICQKEFTNRLIHVVKTCGRTCGDTLRAQNQTGKIKAKAPIEEKFWSKVDKSAGPDGCWLWTAQIGKNGYGFFTTIDSRTQKHRPQLAHRIAYELTYGEIPEGKLILHSCPGDVDHRNCVNPSHTRPGTHQENMDDMVARGNQKIAVNKAKNDGHFKLNMEKAEEIRTLYASGKYLQKELAEMFGCSEVTISHTILGRIWS